MRLYIMTATKKGTISRRMVLMFTDASEFERHEMFYEDQGWNVTYVVHDPVNGILLEHIAVLGDIRDIDEMPAGFIKKEDFVTINMEVSHDRD